MAAAAYAQHNDSDDSQRLRCRMGLILALGVLEEEQRRQRHWAYLTRAAPSNRPSGSAIPLHVSQTTPWQTLYNSRIPKAFIVTTGIDTVMLELMGIASSALAR